MSRLRCAAQDQTALLTFDASLGEELSGPQAVVRLGPWLPGVNILLFTVAIPAGNMLLPFIESKARDILYARQGSSTLLVCGMRYGAFGGWPAVERFPGVRSRRRYF